MATDLYILGTSHPLQCGSDEFTQESIIAFDAELRRLCESFKIRRIAEEMTIDGLARFNVAESVGQRVAKGIGIAHQPVDLTPQERIGISIDDSVVIATVRRYHIFDGGPFREAFDDLADGIRERVWLVRMLSREEWPILFICGSDHVISVRRLWRRLGVDAKVVHRDYEP